MTTNLNNTTPSHPVLYYEDSGCEQGFTNASFKPTVEAEAPTDRPVLALRVSFGLDCPEIQSWIDRGDALFYVNMECPTSYYRESRLVSEPEFSFDIPAERIRRSLDVCVSVVAARDFSTRADESYAPAFRGLQIPFEKGELLAIGGTTRLDWENAGSSGLPVVVAKMSESDKRRFFVDCSAHELQIFLPDELFQIYNRLGTQSAPFALLVQRAFTEALASVHAKAVEEAADNGADPVDATIDATDRDWLRYVDSKLKDGFAGSDMEDGVNSIDWSSTCEDRSLTCVMDAFFRNVFEEALRELDQTMNETDEATEA